MKHDQMDKLELSEISLIKIIVESVTNSTLTNFNFSEYEIHNLLKTNNIQSQTLTSLQNKLIIETSIIKKCNSCDLNVEFCTCEIPKNINIKYFSLNMGKLLNYIFNTIEDFYICSAKTRIINKDIIEIILNNNEIDIRAFLYLNKLTNEFIQSVNLPNCVLISMMPVDYVEIENSNNKIYEWHEILNKDNVDNIYRVFKEINKQVKSKELYYLDLGDDLEIRQIEIIRDLFRTYLIKNKFQISQASCFKDEISDYNLPLNDIREYYINSDQKIAVIKPNDKKIYVAYFKNGVISRDENLFIIINKFDMFIKERIQKYRKLKSNQENASLFEKVIQLFAPFINVATIIVGAITNNKVFVKLFEIIKGNTVLWIMLSINIISLIAIFYYTLLPNIKLGFFNWSRGIKKLYLL